MKTWSVSYRRQDPEGVEWQEIEHDIEAEDAKAALLTFFAEYGLTEPEEELVLGNLVDAKGESLSTEHLTAAQTAGIVLAGGTASFFCGADTYEVTGTGVQEDHTKPCPLCDGKGRVREQEGTLVGCR